MKHEELVELIQLEETLDGFSAVLPGHWVNDLLLRGLRFVSAGACFVLGEVVAVGLSLLTAVPISFVIDRFFLGWLMVLVPMIVFFGACVGAVYGREMSHWAFDRVDEVRQRRRQPLVVQGDLLRIGERRFPLSDIETVRTQGYDVNLVMRDGTEHVLAAPLSGDLRRWLQSTLQDILQRRDRGVAADIPHELSALARGQQAQHTN